VGHSLSRVKPYQIECLTSVEMSRLIRYQAIDAMLLHIQQAEELLSIVHRKPVSLRFPSLVRPKNLVVTLSRDG